MGGRISRWKEHRIERLRCEFLPAALAVEQTPPNPLGRLFSLLIISLFVIALLWGWFGRIDIVAVAQGKLVPAEGVASIQSELSGRVAQVAVNDGDRVKAGDLLLTLDDTLNGADIDSLREQVEVIAERLVRQQYRRSLLELMRSIPLLALLEDQQPPGELLPDAQSMLLLQRQWELLRSTRLASKAHVAGLNAQLRALHSEQQKIKRTLPMMEERRNALKSLYDRQMAPRLQYLDAEQVRIEAEQSLKALFAREAQLLAEIDRVRAEDQLLLANHAREALTLEESLALELQQLKQQVIKAQRGFSNTRITSPTEGIVRSVIPIKPGSVVQAAQVLMEIVPTASELRAEAWIKNRDIGFVAQGQAVEVKVDTFNYTRYGGINGEVALVSADSVNDSNQGLLYKAIVTLASNRIEVDGQDQPLASGMNVAVEIKTGTRRLLDFFLSPLLRYSHESIRER